MTDPAVVEVVRRVDASPEDVWPYLTDGSLWSRWQGAGAVVEARPGGQYRMEMADGSFASGVVVVVVPFRSITFTWGWTGAPFTLAPGSTTVQITLERDGDATVIRLVHRDLPDGLRPPHVEGWVHYVGRLAVLASGGDPGPDITGWCPRRDHARLAGRRHLSPTPWGAVTVTPGGGRHPASK